MRVGADIGAVCRRCGDVWHVVVAIVDGRIARVECKQCGGRHRYRAAHGSRPERGGRRAGRAGGPGVERRTRRVEADPGRSLRPYLSSDLYASGDRLLHPLFGEGVVQSAGPTKVRVLFAGGEKMLVHARDRAG